MTNTDFDASLRAMREARRPERTDPPPKPPVKKPQATVNAAHRKAEHLHANLTRLHAPTLDLGELGHIVRVALDLAGTEAFPAADEREPKPLIFDDLGNEIDQPVNPKTGEKEDRTAPEWDPTYGAASALRAPSARAAKDAQAILDAFAAILEADRTIRNLVPAALGHIPPEQRRPWCTTCKRPQHGKLIDGRCSPCYQRERRAS